MLNCTKWKCLCNSFTIDKQFVKVLLTKAVRYVYTCVYINTDVYTYVKSLYKKNFLRVHKTTMTVLVSFVGLAKIPFEYDVKQGTELQLR